MIIKPELLDRLGINKQVTAMKRNQLKFLVFKILTLYLRYRLHFNTPKRELYISADSHRLYSYSFFIYSNLHSFIADIYSEVFPQSSVDEYFTNTSSIMSFTIENEFMIRFIEEVTHLLINA